MNDRLRLYQAFAAADARGVLASPACVLAEVGESGAVPAVRILAAGSPADVAAHPAAASARAVDLPTSVLLPGLVNAHTHLDLTHLGPLRYEPAQGFAGWADVIIRGRRRDPEGIARSVEQGVRASLAGGVVAVGDIAGEMWTVPLQTLRAGPLLGVSYIEYFGLGNRQAATMQAVQSLLDGPLAQPHPRVRLGLQPHAPYTAGPELMRWTAHVGAARRIPICTHAAENPQERQFVAHGTGPFRTLLERLDLWTDSVLDGLAAGRTPLAHMAPALERGPWLLAHVNDCDDAGLDVLARTGASVVYSPRSSEYFLNHEAFGPHRYRDMLRAGVNVALGTDSVVNLPSGERISTFDEMRLLHARDGVDAFTLLRMATLNGALALGLEPGWFRIEPGTPIAGLIAVEAGGPTGDPLRRALAGTAAPRLLAHATGFHAGEGAG